MREGEGEREGGTEGGRKRGRGREGGVREKRRVCGGCGQVRDEGGRDEGGRMREGGRKGGREGVYGLWVREWAGEL